ncbi:glycosyltransferase [Elusimicrobiota bacterium]
MNKDHELGQSQSNVFSVDVEDWYQGIEQPLESWGNFEQRLRIGLDRVLGALSDADSTKATFFILGWVAQAYPQVVRDISNMGHEVATHGYAHIKAYEMTPRAFEEDARRAKDCIESLAGRPVCGYRAPYFSITKKCLWSLEILKRLGFRYDASIFPGANYRYGITGAPEHVYRIKECDLIECPISTFDLLGKKFGIGGSYLRILPLFATTYAINKLVAQGSFASVYVHPWECDPEHPRVSNFRLKARLTHYALLHTTLPKIHSLLQQFKFTSFENYLDIMESSGRIPTYSMATAFRVEPAQGNPIKIVRVIDRLNIGGPAIHVTLLSKHLDGAKPQVVADAARNDIDEFNSDQAAQAAWQTRLVIGKEECDEGNMMGFAQENGVYPTQIVAIRREINLVNDLIGFWKLLSIIRKEKPSIVHTHKSKAGVLGRLAAWFCGVPVVVHTYHGHVLYGYFGRMKTGVYILIERMMAKITHRIIAVSDKVRKDLLDLKIAGPEKIETIYLGFNLDKFTVKEKNQGVLRKDLGLENDVPVVGIVARLVPIKGVHIFLRAAKIILRSEPRTRFVVIGDGELRRDLESLANDLGVADRVYFAGFRMDVEELYCDLDVLTLTSRNEGSPVSLIEGLASGCAAVSMNVGGVSDVIKDGVTGILVKPNDSEAMADAVVGLLHKQQKRVAMGAAGRKDVQERFSVERLACDVRSLYIRLLDEQSGCRHDADRCN